MLVLTATAKLVLEYIDTLIWPLLLVAAVVIVYLKRPFAEQLRDLMSRFLGSESGELSGGIAGFQVAIRFQERVADLARLSGAADTPELREIQQTLNDLTLEEFRSLASNFYDAPLAVRREMTPGVRRLAGTLTIDALLTFAESPNNGERVGAAMGLGVHVRSSVATLEDARVQAAVGRLLGDANSRVRYRAVQAVEGTALAAEFSSQLRSLSEDNSNSVRKRARSALDGTT
jgi:hypothetical protein